MRGIKVRSAGAAVILIIVVVLASFYYPRANPGLASTTTETSIASSASTSSGTTSSTSSISTTQSSTFTFVTTRSNFTTNTNKQVSITIPFGAHYQLYGPNGQYYRPGNVTILAGATVTWVNEDNYTHGLQADNGAFYKYTIQPSGGTYSVTFNVPGTFTYRCTIHSWMSGEIIVIAA